MRVITHRLSAAVLTVPITKAWLYTAALLVLLTVVALPIGFLLGFLQFELLKASWGTITGIVIGSFFTPAVTEELFFRVLLLPRSTELISVSGLWLWGSLSLVMFIVYHPLNAVTFFPKGRVTFFNLVFLLLAALLGFVCSLAYLQSGSIWTSVVIHWLAVVVWLLLLGGYKKLYC